MRRIGYILLLLLILKSCEKENIPEIGFRVHLDGFSMSDDPDYPEPEHASFRHRYSDGLISFTRGQQTHDFYVQTGEIEEYLFKLTPGEYILDAKIPDASIYGQAAASFHVETDTVTITELTDTLTINVNSSCSMILISDELEQLDEGPFIIERHSNYSYSKTYPIARDSTSGLYYVYFTPDPVINDPSAFLWFYGEKPGAEEGGMPTSRFEVGYKYYISILE